MSCACGHHHSGHHHAAEAGGEPIMLQTPMIALSGQLICKDTAQMMMALSLLPDHVRLSRGEPGCLRFDIWQGDDPMIWHLSELFVNANAFATHQARSANGEWARDSAAIGRDFSRNEILPCIRPEHPADQTAIDALNQTAFKGPDEARLVRDLRDQGDLHLSLVAVAAGTILGHIALSPIGGDRPALALAPVAVLPRAQGIGIGAALIRAAIDDARDLPVVVLGDPAYYSRFGFRPARLSSPYAGPYLQVLGDLPDNAAIRHAPAFASI